MRFESMKRRIAQVLLSGILVSNGAGADDKAASSDVDQSYSVAAIRARFIVNATGAVESEDDSKGRGWNIITSAETVLVLVDIAGVKFPTKAPAVLDFAADAGKHRLLTRTVSLRRGYFSESGQTTVPFLVYGVGCESIRLSATLRIGGLTKRLKSEIPLACGE